MAPSHDPFKFEFIFPINFFLKFVFMKQMQRKRANYQQYSGLETRARTMMGKMNPLMQ